MIRIAPLALATLLAATAPAYIAAQTPHFNDPANLRGERVSPRTGRELPIDQGALGLEELLRKLNTRASILNIVAHPDDEDGGMLTLYSRGLGARVADLSLTRGEGGQNAATSDFDDALGLLRTQELLANDRYTGVTQMFGTEVDFGFSKTKAESFAKWGHQRVLYDVVRAIRLYRPLVITATFIGNPTDGHGQHQVSGEIAQEAFVAAGNPSVFPELTKEGILPWQPLKMYARAPMQAISSKGLFDYATGQYAPAQFTNYVTGVTSTTPPTPDITIHEGTDDPLITTCAANPSDLPPQLKPASSAASDCRPLSYVQFARIGLGLQRTQIGPGVRNAPSGRFDVPYHLYGSRLCGTPVSLKNCHPERSEGPAVPLALAGAPPSTRSGRVGYRAARDKTTPQQNSVILSEGSQASSQAAVEGSAIPPVAALPLDPSGHKPPSSQPDFFDGIDTSLDGILSLDKNAPLSDAAWEHITQSIAEAQRHFDPQHPERIAPLLADALANMDLEINLLGKNERPSIARESILHELRIKRVQLNDALALALSVHLQANIPADKAMAPSDARSPSPAEVISGSKLRVKLIVSASPQQSLRALSSRVNTSYGTSIHSDFIMTDGDSLPGIPFPTEGKLIRSLLVQVPAGAAPTMPYFWRGNVEQPFYDLQQPDLRNAASTPPPFVATATFSYERTQFEVATPVADVQTYPSGETSVQPLSITPPISLSLKPSVGVFFDGKHSLSLTAVVHSKGLVASQATVSIQMPEGWIANPKSAALPRAAGDYNINFTVNAPASFRDLRILEAIVQTPAGSYTEGYRPVGYGDLPRTNIYTPATDRIVPVDLKLPPPDKRRIGYLEGTGDDVPAALASIGLKPTMLTVADLTPEKLSHFDTVILGVRTYNAHPDLHGAPTQALLDFARNGGNVLVQYQTYEFTAADAPYPLELGRAEKVVDETDPVEILHADSTRFTTPNHINTTDFDHWIEERGHGFLGSWDPHYTALTETHDPGQAPQKGGLITVQLGRGHWTYCAFALYRQLPEAVPGAFRLFVNLLSP